MNSILASYHHYFVTAVLEKLKSHRGSPLDTFGEGGNSFVIKLFPYSKLVYELVEAFDDSHSGKWKESMMLELVAFVANQFLFLAFRDQQNNQAAFPEPTELEPMIEVYLLNLAK